jgi:RecA/RadA recombinase
MGRPKKVDSEAVAQVKRKAKKEALPEKEPKFDKVVSTGSTLLDLAISGRRVRGGGIPGGIFLELFGPPSAGKTALLCEILASAQIRGGQTKFADSEARLDSLYAKAYDFAIDPNDETVYCKPKTVEDMFSAVLDWRPENSGAINVFAGDSIAVLTTDLELSAEGDKRGQKRAKDIHAGLRKTRIMVEENSWIVALTNHELAGERTTTTPGGKGLPFYASLRLKVSLGYPKRTIEVYRTVNKKKIERIKGILSSVKVVKSSLDEPYREAPIYIMFNIGIDDVRANLQWMKDTSGNTIYDAITEEFQELNKAIDHIEENNLEDELREKVIDMWEGVEKMFDSNRKKKQRR